MRKVIFILNIRQDWGFLNLLRKELEEEIVCVKNGDIYDYDIFEDCVSFFMLQ